LGFPRRKKKREGGGVFFLVEFEKREEIMRRM